jgi:hypothetical protein
MGKTDAFAGRYPFQSQSAGIQPDLFQHFLGDIHCAEGVIISGSDVVAVVQMAASYKNGILSGGESPEYMRQINPGRTHDPNEPDIGGVLESGDTRQIRTSVAAPVAYETQHSRFKSCLGCHIPPLLNNVCFIICHHPRGSAAAASIWLKISSSV